MAPDVTAGLEHIWLPFTQMADFVRDPLVATDALGIRVTDARGRTFIDGISGAQVSNLGYSNAVVKKALQEQIEELSFWPVLHGTTPPAVRLAARLAEVLPGDLSRTMLLSGGSEATEAAVKMARQHHLQTDQPLRYKVISRYSSYHGATRGALAASGVSDKQRFEPLAPGYIHVQPPYCYRCPFGKEPGSCNVECASAVEATIRAEGSQTVSAVIVDPVMSAAGVLVAPPAYFEMLREICDRTGVLLIFDEVLTGFGRTGRMFAADHYGVTPDIICLGKGISSGYIPLAAVSCTERVAAAFEAPGQPGRAFAHINTYGGHPVAAAGGLAVLDELERLDVVANAARVGAYLMDQLQALGERFAVIGDVRGLGMLVGVEMVRDRTTRELFPKDQAIVPRLMARAFERGLITRGSRHVLILAPPLIATKADIDEIIGILAEVMAEVTAELGV